MESLNSKEPFWRMVVIDPKAGHRALIYFLSCQPALSAVGEPFLLWHCTFSSNFYWMPRLIEQKFSSRLLRQRSAENRRHGHVARPPSSNRAVPKEEFMGSSRDI